MRSFTLIALAGLVASAAALPYGDDKKYDEKKVDYYKDDHKDDYKKDDYKKDDYKDDSKDDHKDWSDDDKTKHESLSAFPFHFTSTYYAKATPDTIVNNSQVSVPGQPGASGHFSFGINAAQEVICYNITLQGVEGTYQSPARTATHIHEAPKGRAGPPRLAFDNPTGDGYTRTSFGCLKGPFRTGVNGTDGADTGSGFSLYEIEENPSGFFADTHTSAFLAGAVRGQLEKKH